jgi:hypothetical protein
MIDTATEKGHYIFAGEKVRLKSGSPILSVIASEGDSVTVEWQSTRTFPAACLERIFRKSLVSTS